MNRVRNGLKDESETSLVLSLVLHNLSLEDFPYIPDPDRGLSTRTSHTYAGLHMLLYLLGHNPHPNPPITSNCLLRFVEEHWPKIWAWSTFLIKYWVDNVVHTPEALAFRVKFRTVVVSLMMTIALVPARLSKGRQLLFATPRLIQTAIRLFILIASEKNYPMGNESTLTLQLLYHMDPIIWEKEFSVAVAQSSRDVAKIFIQYIAVLIEATVEPDDVRAQAIDGAAFMIRELARCSPHTHRALLENDSISWMTQALAVLVARQKYSLDRWPLWPVDPRLQGTQNCALYLSTCFDEGSTWISKALRGRLLVSLFKSRPLLAEEQHQYHDNYPDSSIDQLYARLLQQITPHLLYDSVLREAVRSIKTIEARGLEPDIETALAPDSPMWTAWMNLKSETRDRNEHKQRYRALSINPCQNETVSLNLCDLQ